MSTQETLWGIPGLPGEPRDTPGYHDTPGYPRDTPGTAGYAGVPQNTPGYHAVPRVPQGMPRYSAVPRGFLGTPRYHGVPRGTNGDPALHRAKWRVKEDQIAGFDFLPETLLVQVHEQVYFLFIFKQYFILLVVLTKITDFVDK